MTNIRGAIQKHPLASYTVIAYAISWILVIPFILSEWGVLHGDYRIAFIIKSFGPFAAALIVTGITEGKQGIETLRGRIRQWRAGWVWYALTLLAIPALFMIGLLIQPGAASGFTGLTPAVIIGYLVSFVIVAFGGGPLGEEPGWRGFALPRLQGTYGSLKGTLLLSLIWTCWHLPDFLTSAQGGGPGVPASTLLVNFVLFLLLVTSLSILFTWLFNHTGGSIFMAILAHASVNTPQVALVPMFPAVTTTMLNTGALIGFGVAALVVLLVTKGKLSCKEIV
ncbi:CAAX amino protease [Leptolinea sp. HRD-7]|nr:CAAX amino protease [Leptolinea sp. HRD-7]